MKKYILVFMLFITAFAFSFDYTYQKMDSESTVALINNDEIISMDYLLSQTDSIKILDDLKNNYSDFFNILSTTEEGMNFLNKYYKTVLDKIIYKKLFVNYVESLGINISREELKTYYTEKISQIFEDSGMSDEDTNLYLYSQGYPNKETYIEANYFDSLYKNAINLLYNNQYDAITVSDEEIDSEYNQNKKLYVSDNKGLIKVIYFDKKEDSDYYYQKILNGELNYDDIYKTLEESQESSSLEVNLDTSEGQIVDLIKANFPGFISKPMQSDSDGKYIILKIEKKMPSKSLSPEEAKDTVIFNIKDKKVKDYFDKILPEEFNKFKESQNVVVNSDLIK